MKIKKEYARYLGLGAEIAASIAIPIGLGYAADYYFNTDPIGIIVGAIFGMLLFISLVFRISKDLNK